ncbi:TetR/AcrR family transcriptional regulator [Bacillus tianshenii]|nr:TetR/AcrR family transcriptional regulator [Bacillus tianshenii]
MKRNPEERKRQILKAAFRAVADKGFGNVTLQMIADYAGVSKGVPNYYFENKEDVLAHLLEWMTEKIYEKESANIGKVATAEAKLTAYLDTVFASPEENRQFYRVYLDFLAHAKTNERYRQINEQFYRNCWRLGEGIIQQGIKENIFEVEDISDAAAAIRAMIDGCLIQWLMLNKDELHLTYKHICYSNLITYLQGTRSCEKTS